MKKDRSMETEKDGSMEIKNIPSKRKRKRFHRTQNTNK